MEHRSDQINELAAALAKTQGEMSNAAMDSANPFFKSKYANLTSIVASSRPALARNGLAVTQNIIVDASGQHELHTELLHASGQWTKSIAKIAPQKADIQSWGSAVSYLRRYCYASLIGVIVGEDDDDGEAAMAEQRKSSTYNKPYARVEVIAPAFKEPEPVKIEESEKISKDQLDEMLYELEMHPAMAKDILEKMNLSTFADLKKSLFLPTMKRIRELQLAENINKKRS
jgi:hypothetical protein